MMLGTQSIKNQREEEEHRPSPRASFSLKAHDISASSLCVADTIAFRSSDYYFCAWGVEYSGCCKFADLALKWRLSVGNPTHSPGGIKVPK